MEWRIKIENSQDYLAKKSFFAKIITIYGRNAVSEILDDKSITIHKLHLSESNKKAIVLDNMITTAKRRDINIEYHNKKALSRISKNGKQDQGVALDIVLEHAMNDDNFLKTYPKYKVIALDGINNPKNLGMIIRSCVAGNIDAIILPTKSSAQITPLVIKASVGTFFKIPIIKTDNLFKTLEKFKKANSKLYNLSPNVTNSYKDEKYGSKTLFILGNESDGVTEKISSLCDISIYIPMRREVESLNVAVTASLLAFL